MLMTIAALLVLLWLIGLIVNIGGGFIHLLLIVAAVVFVYDVLVKRRHTV